MAFGSFSKEVYGTQYTKHMIEYPLCQNPTTTLEVFSVFYNIFLVKKPQKYGDISVFFTS